MSFQDMTWYLTQLYWRTNMYNNPLTIDPKSLPTHSIDEIHSYKYSLDTVSAYISDVVHCDDMYEQELEAADLIEQELKFD